jgi:hypothetical protein
VDFHHLLEATGIVVAGVFFYSLAYGWFEPDDPHRRLLWVMVLGLAWGAIAVVLMTSHIETAEGSSSTDARSRWRSSDSSKAGAPG